MQSSKAAPPSRFRHSARFLHQSSGPAIQTTQSGFRVNGVSCQAQFNPVATASVFSVDDLITHFQPRGADRNTIVRDPAHRSPSQTTIADHLHSVPLRIAIPSLDQRHHHGCITQYRTATLHPPCPWPCVLRLPDCEPSAAHYVPSCRLSHLTRQLDRLSDRSPRPTLPAAIRGSTQSTQPDRDWQASPMLARAT